MSEKIYALFKFEIILNISQTNVMVSRYCLWLYDSVLAVIKTCSVVSVDAVKTCRGSRGIAPFSLNHCTRWKCLTSHTSRITPGTELRCPLNRTLD
jgi:hypothetical protein